MKLTVECGSGYAGEREPTSFALGVRRIEVAHVLDRWPSAQCCYYKVETTDGARFILRFDEGTREWELTWFSATG